MQSEIGDGGDKVALLVNYLPKVIGKEIRIGIQGIKQLHLLVIQHTEKTMDGCGILDCPLEEYPVVKIKMH